ncbi:hypothetical protein BsWGS_28215 [Bradybaena similaris]
MRGPTLFCALLLAELFLLRGSHGSYDCLPGIYGSECQYSCGRCHGGNIFCDVYDGYCNDGCEPGFTGERCQLRCPYGRFGPQCRHKCGKCGTPRSICDPETGFCLGSCVPGYQLPYCSEECPAGKYGPDCRHRCGHCSRDSPICHPVSGNCTSACEHGYKMPQCIQDESFLPDRDAVLRAVWILGLCCFGHLLWTYGQELVLRLLARVWTLHQWSID